jgi:Helix-turn-helix domain
MHRLAPPTCADRLVSGAVREPLVQMYRRRGISGRSGHRIASAGTCVGVDMERESNADASPMIERLTVTVEEAAVMLGISRTSAYGCASRDEIPTVRLGRRLVVPLIQLAAMLNGEQRALDGEGSDVG